MTPEREDELFAALLRIEAAVSGCERRLGPIETALQSVKEHVRLLFVRAFGHGPDDVEPERKPRNGKGV